MTTDPLLTPVQVAERLQLSERTLANQRAQRVGLPYLKVGGAVRYRSSDIEKFLAANVHEPLPRVPVKLGRPRRMAS